MFVYLKPTCLYSTYCGLAKCIRFSSSPLLSLCSRRKLQSKTFCNDGTKENETIRNEDASSWVRLLYENDADCQNGSLRKLRRKLNVALTSTRSHEKGDLLPYLVVQDLVRFYDSLEDLEEKAVLFNHLSNKLGVDFDAVLSNVYKSQDTLQNERLRYRYQQNLVHSLTPSYKHLFDDISKLRHGTYFLVNMRKDLRMCISKKHLAKTPSLLSFDTCLKEHLARWFANGFLDLEVVSWEKSSAQLLEKVMRYEAVHVMSDWEDLKSRAGAGRRIFTFSHRLMPDEPLVILHTLLGNTIPCNIEDVLSARHKLNGADVTTATFYSVTSTQRGLDGIGLGNLLIKRVVEKLKNEFYNMSDFVTLSPIPGFRKWLDLELLTVESCTQQIPRQLQNVCDDGAEGLIRLKNHLAVPNWHEDDTLCNILEKPLTTLCVRYLIHTKHRGFAINPVAHFHLRNGACLWRINWLGNTQSYGIKSSYGLMANYKYELTELETNNNNYVQLGKIAVSQSIQKYLRS